MRRTCPPVSVIRILFAATLLTMTISPQPIAAEDASKHPQANKRLEAVQRLRSSGKYKEAVASADALLKSPDLTKETRAVLQFERGLALNGWASSAKDAKTRFARQQAGVKSIAAFLKEQPKHKRASEAHMASARIRRSLAQLEMLAAERERDAKKNAAFLTQARENLRLASAAAQSATKLTAERWKSFPRFIPRDKTELYRARQQAEVEYMMAQLESPVTTYQTAQTYKKGLNKRQSLLQQAENEFAHLHSRYRTQVAGLYAHLWQARCLQERDQIGRAMGIYNELIGHPSKNRFYLRLRDQAIHFRLVCYNHSTRKDYHLAVASAKKWLKDKDEPNETSTGRGIRWQLAVALEQLGLKEKDETARLARFREAISHARQLANRASRHQTAAKRMVARLMIATGAK